MAACGVSAVCGEVVESVLAFLRLQMRLFRWPEVRISNVLTVRCLHNQTRELCCQFEASVTDLREFNMDEKRFLNELYRNSRYLSHAVSRSCKSSIKLISQANQRNGLCTELHICTPEPIVVESLNYTPAGCKSEGFQLSFFLHVGEATLLSETNNFLSCLHLLHIVNPDVFMSLQSPTTISTPQLEGTTEAMNICIEQESYQTIGAFRVALSTEHYIPSNPPHFSTKMHFVRGSAYHLHGDHGDLKLYCCAALTPSSIKSSRSKVRANHLCGAIHVSTDMISVFGPTFAPIARPGTCPQSDIASLARWNDYGLKVSRHKTHDTEGGLSFAMEVTDSNAENTRSMQACTSGVLHLLLFLECKAPLHVASDWEEWASTIRLAMQLEENFSSLLARYKAKFQQASHSALSKILYNYKTCEKTSVVTTMAIQKVSEAVASIIHHSTRSELRTMCAQQLQQEASNGTNSSWETHIRDKLWSVATQMGIVALASDMDTSSPEECSSSVAAHGPYLSVEIATSAHPYQNDNSPLLSDVSMEQAAFEEEQDSKPVYAPHVGPVSTASVQNTTTDGSPVEWNQHIVTNPMLPREDVKHADSFERLTEAGGINVMPGQIQGMQTLLFTSTDGGCQHGSTKASYVEDAGGGLGQQQCPVEITRLRCGTGSDKQGTCAHEEDSGEQENFSNGCEDFSSVGDFSDDCSEDFSGHKSESSYTGNKEDSIGTEDEDFEDDFSTGDEEELCCTGDEEKICSTGDEEELCCTGDEEELCSTGDEEKICSTGDEEDFSDKESLGVNENGIGDNFSDECRYSSNDDDDEDTDFRSKQNYTIRNGLCNAECKNSPTSNSTVDMHTNIIHLQQPPPAHSAVAQLQQCEPCSPIRDSDAEWDSLDASLSR